MDLTDLLLGWIKERVIDTPTVLDLDDGGRAFRRCMRRLNFYVISDEFRNIYEPPHYNFIEDDTESNKVRELKIAKSKDPSYRHLERPIPIRKQLTAAQLRKIERKVLSEDIFTLESTGWRAYTAYCPLGFPVSFTFCRLNQTVYSAERYDMQVQIGEWLALYHTHSPGGDVPEGEIPTHLLENLIYDIRIVNDIICPKFIEYSNMELEHAKIPIPTGKAARNVALPKIKSEKGKKKTGKYALWSHTINRINYRIQHHYIAHRELPKEVFDQLFDLVLKNGLVNCVDDNGHTFLAATAFCHYAEGVEQILKAEGVDVNLVGTRGTTPLCEALIRDMDAYDCIKLLLDAGADPNVTTDISSPPLHEFASPKGRFTKEQIDYRMRVVQLLLDHGADPYLENRFGDNAFDLYVNEPEIYSLMENYVAAHKNKLQNNE